MDETLFKKLTRISFDDFKHNIVNAPFIDIDDDYYSTCLNDLESDISGSFIKASIKNEFNIESSELNNLIDKYQKIAHKSALNYIQDFKKKSNNKE
ncbi:hypothetical protein [Lutibacter maritimus]|uniref:Uncharacterized protein n=1 Tax=Lutibacter maritimus TaxID=593133 RepID=A0A1I6NSK2_9FLAO|nr:hypothetical protein [Lutibacter maritimus]SFS30904.1 hypothetical protein SAMN04488006_0503 [Lutibacter maritimus]